MPQIKSIVIVEDDPLLRQTLADGLKEEGYTVTTAVDGQMGLELARIQKPNLIILDVKLSGLDGLSVCRKLRHELDPAIIIVSDRSGEVDVIVGLDSGADDYIIKPLRLGEFFARVRAAMRRQPKPIVTERLKSGDLSLDLTGRKAYRGQQTLNLSVKEFDLLAELIRNQGMVLSRDLLLAKVWGNNTLGESRTVDVHIRWLREKIEERPSKPKRILTVPRIGYRFEG